MTRDAAVALILARLGNRQGLATQAIAEMQLAQTTLEQDAMLHPWFLRKREADITTTTLTNHLIFVNQILALQDITPPGFYQDPDTMEWIPLEIVREVIPFYTAADAAAAGVDTGAPQLLDVASVSFGEFSAKVYPFPDRAYNIILQVYSPAPTLETDIENAWLKYAPELLIAKTGLNLARFLRDPGGEKLFREDYEEARSALVRRNVAVDEKGTPAEIGEAF